MIGPLIFGYATAAVFFGIVAGAFGSLDEEDDTLALQFTIGALWPIVLVVAFMVGIVLGAIALGRSYAAMWRKWRPRRQAVEHVELPTARATKPGRGRP